MISSKIILSRRKIQVAKFFPELENEKLNWLQQHIDPVEKVRDYWNSTFEARKSKLKEGLLIHEYYEKYPCLALSLGADLVRNLLKQN